MLYSASARGFRSDKTALRRQILAGHDPNPNDSVVPFVCDDDVMHLHIMYKLPKHFGGTRTVSWFSFPVLLFECSQKVVFTTIVSVIRVHQPAEADAGVLAEQVPILCAFAWGDLPYLSHVQCPFVRCVLWGLTHTLTRGGRCGDVEL